MLFLRLGNAYKRLPTPFSTLYNAYKSFKTPLETLLTRQILPKHRREHLLPVRFYQNTVENTYYLSDFTKTPLGTLITRQILPKHRWEGLVTVTRAPKHFWIHFLPVRFYQNTAGKVL
jgi:hypothetical protein